MASKCGIYGCNVPMDKHGPNQHTPIQIENSQRRADTKKSKAIEKSLDKHKK